MRKAKPRTKVICPEDRAPANAPVRSPGRLTSRQYDVLALLAAGYPMKVVADRLGITYRTVTFHKYRTMQRLSISTNAGLIAHGLTHKNGSEQDPSSAH
jgi:DNA-binding NarL/FixJ family response regulator